MLHKIIDLIQRLSERDMRARNLKRVVTLVLVSYNYPAMLQECLTTLIATRETYPFHLVIIDNDSVPETKAILREYERLPYVRVVYMPANVNYVKALKAGLAEVRTPYTVTIQTDMTFPEKRWLSYMMERYRDGTLLFINQHHPETRRWCYGFCFLIDTATYRRVGVNDRFVLCCEDWDFMNRLVAANGKRSLMQSRGPYVFHRTCYIRQDREGAVTSPIEAKDQETYRSIWGECRFPRHRIRSV
ncbi:MAG: glycosyltransferase [Spirochaetes bacterium]|nr:glycosyltransferase [Spirochaetota bacterium]